MQQSTPIRVFVVDDHPIVTTGLSYILNKSNYCHMIGFAHSQNAMIQQLKQLHPQIILLDLNIPGSDFYDNISQIRRICPWAKILVYTAYYGPDLEKPLRKVGVSGCLLKGVVPAEIIKAIRQVANGEIYTPVLPKMSLADADLPCGSAQDNFRKRLSLSPREQEILGLISSGLTSRIISERLFISKHTVETHRKNILRKLDFSSSTELVKFAVQQGLVS